MSAQGKPVKAIISWEMEGKQELLLHEGDIAEVGREKGAAMYLCRMDMFRVSMQ
jgi:hypothetical protein